MATKKEQAATVEAFLLRDSGFGISGEVVELSAADAQAGFEQGALDLNQAAIDAAKKAK